MAIDYKRVDFNRIVRSDGGIKHPKQSAISFLVINYGGDNVIEICPINPKTNSETTGIGIQFPKEELDNIIEALKSFK